MGISSFLTDLIHNGLEDNDTDAQSLDENTTPDEKSDIIELSVTSKAILSDLSVTNGLETSIPDKAFAAE